MKKTTYILLAAILAFASCAQEFEPEIQDNGLKTVPIIMSFSNDVTLQAQTKVTAGMAMGPNPAIKTIHVAVFGSSGYLQDYTNAIPCDASGNEISGFLSSNATTGYFKVRLPINEDGKRRTIHVIGNGPSSVPFNAYEDDIMQSMTVTDGNGAYWTRFEASSGIQVKKVLNTNGEWIYETDSNGEYIPTDATSAPFQNLVLIRNFAAVTVKCSDSVDNFNIVGYTVCNMPSEGNVAIYSTNHGGWVSNYQDKALDSTTGIISYDGKEYPGFPASPEIDTHIPMTAEAFFSAGEAVGPGESKYIYERAVTTDVAPFIMLAGKYVDPGTTDKAAALAAAPICYYRLDITKDDRYVPLYRNHKYIITFTSISVAGYSTPAEASIHNSGDNFSVSLDAQTLSDVSNGKTRFFVEHAAVDMVYTTDSQSMWYQFHYIPDDAYFNGTTASATSDGGEAYVTVTEKDGGNALASFTIGDADDAQNRRTITYTVKEPGESTLVSVLRITGVYTDHDGATTKLIRDVTIRVFNPYSITPTLSPDTVAPKAGEETTLSIPLKWDFDWAMFPMDFYIEDTKHTLNPNSDTDDIPVMSGTSIVDNKTPSYYFLETLNWSEYEALKEDATLAGATDLFFSIPLKTITDNSATTIYVYNKYIATDANGITTATVALANDALNMISPTKQTISGTSATVTVFSEGPWTLSIALSNGATATGTSLSQTAGMATTSSGTDVTVTIPESESENPVSYTLTFINTASNITRKATLIQKGISASIESSTTSISVAGGNVSVDVTSDIAYLLDVVDESNTALYTSSSYPAASSSTTRTVTIPQNTTSSSRTLKIRLRNEAGTFFKYVEIEQEGPATMTALAPAVGYNATTADVKVKSIFDYKLKVYDASDNLVSTTDGTATSSEVTKSVSLGSENNTGADRKFTIQLCNSSDVVYATITVTQLATVFPEITLSPTDVSIKGNVTTTTVTVTANCNWTAAIDDSSLASVDVTSGSSSTTTITVTFTGGKNYTVSDKVATLTVSDVNGYVSQNATVTQRGLSSATVNSNSLTSGQPLSGSDSRLSMTSSANVTGNTLRIESGNLTITGTGDDFCGIDSATLTYRNGNNSYIASSLTVSENEGTAYANSSVTNWQDSDISTPVTKLVLTPSGNSWQVQRLSASYYYWQ